MNTKALKFLAHALVFMMIVELAVMNINISAFSIETISLAEMDRLKCQSVKWIKKEQNRGKKKPNRNNNEGRNNTIKIKI